MSSSIFWAIFEGPAKICRLVGSFMLFIFNLISSWMETAELPQVCVCPVGCLRDSGTLLLFPWHFLSRAVILTKVCNFLVATCQVAKYLWNRRTSGKYLAHPSGLLNQPMMAELRLTRWSWRSPQATLQTSLQGKVELVSDLGMLHIVCQCLSMTTELSSPPQLGSGLSVQMRCVGYSLCELLGVGLFFFPGFMGRILQFMPNLLTSVRKALVFAWIYLIIVKPTGLLWADRPDVEKLGLVT